MELYACSDISVGDASPLFWPIVAQLASLDGMIMSSTADITLGFESTTSSLAMAAGDTESRSGRGIETTTVITECWFVPT